MKQPPTEARVLAGSNARWKRRPASPEAIMRTCPICSTTLEERKCKLFCPDPVCGYFLSCADYY